MPGKCSSPEYHTQSLYNFLLNPFFALFLRLKEVGEEKDRKLLMTDYQFFHLTSCSLQFVPKHYLLVGGFSSQDPCRWRTCCLTWIG